MQIIRMVTAAVVACAIGVAALQAQKPGQTATETYMSYVGTLAKAKSMDELLPYMSAARAGQAKAAPADEKKMMFEFVKEMGAKNVKVVKETPSAAGASLLWDHAGGS